MNLITVAARLSQRQNRTLFWGALLFISYKLLAPSEHSGIDIPHLDKVIHAGIFFVLTGLLIRAYQMTRGQYFTIFAVYGLITEYLQAQTGYRSGDPIDWLANMAGVLLLFAVYAVWLKIVAKTQVKAALKSRS